MVGVVVVGAVGVVGMVGGVGVAGIVGVNGEEEGGGGGIVDRVVEGRFSGMVVDGLGRGERMD